MSKFDILDRMSEETIQQQEDVNPKNTEERPMQESAQPVTLEAVAQEVEPLLRAVLNMSGTVSQEIRTLLEVCKTMQSASAKAMILVVIPPRERPMAWL